eukprot:scaffold101596_cov63-Phaeocystis_antarctica.AAC.2
MVVTTPEMLAVTPSGVLMQSGVGGTVVIVGSGLQPAVLELQSFRVLESIGGVSDRVAKVVQSQRRDASDAGAVDGVIFDVGAVPYAWWPKELQARAQARAQAAAMAAAGPRGRGRAPKHV